MNRINVPSLVTGIVCLGVGVAALSITLGLIPGHLSRQLFAGALIVAGSIGLIVALRYRREDHN